MSRGSVDTRIRRSALLVLAGLLLAVGTLFWDHPLAFIAFLILALLLVGSGIAYYLLTLVRD